MKREGLICDECKSENKYKHPRGWISRQIIDLRDNVIVRTVDFCPECVDKNKVTLKYFL